VRFASVRSADDDAPRCDRSLSTSRSKARVIHNLFLANHMIRKALTWALVGV
jgi:hypothetical protein